MIKYYQLKTRAINIILSIFGKNVFTYVIYSPQRTFSNFFEQLLERNVFINFEKGKKNINYYKHNPGPILDNKIKNKFIVIKHYSYHLYFFLHYFYFFFFLKFFLLETKSDQKVLQKLL